MGQITSIFFFHGIHSPRWSFSGIDCSIFDVTDDVTNIGGSKINMFQNPVIKAVKLR